MAIVIKEGSSPRERNVKAKAFVLKETPALFALLSVLSGSICFWLTVYALCKMINPGFDLMIVVSAIVTTMMSLPKAYQAIKISSAPYLIRFAIGFKAGFLAGVPTVKRIEKLARLIPRLISHLLLKSLPKP